MTTVGSSSTECACTDSGITEGAGRRIACPRDLHAALDLPVPAFPRALEPIAVTAATFSLSLLPELDCGTVSYRCQVGAVRRHKKVAFFEVSILVQQECSTLSAETSSRTQTQLVVDKHIVGDSCFHTTHSLCLGDVLDVEARWIWDPSRAYPLNLAAVRLTIFSRWDTESVVALRKGGFIKFRELETDHATVPSKSLTSQSSHHGNSVSDVAAGLPDGFHSLDVFGTMWHYGGRGSKASKGQSAIKTRRLQQSGADFRSRSGGVDDKSLEDGVEVVQEPGAHCAEGAKDRARKMCAWVCAKMGGSGAWKRGLVLDVAGGAGYLAMEICKRGVSVTIVDPRPPRPFNRYTILPLPPHRCTHRPPGALA